MLGKLGRDVAGQEWSAVAVELLVLVLGIFFGLQADSWYEGLKERERERDHLEQLYEDFGHNAALLEQVANHHAKLEEELMFAIGVLKRGAVLPDEYERFKWAILTMYQYPESGITTGGYDTLIASGDLSIISDPGLRSRMVRVHAGAKLEYRMIEIHASGGRDGAGIRDAGYSIPHPSGRGIEWQVDFDVLAADRHSLGNLANQRRSHGIFKERYLSSAGEFTAMRGRIGEMLGKQGPG